MRRFTAAAVLGLLVLTSAGALRISGSPNQEGDEKCANAELVSVANSLK